VSCEDEDCGFVYNSPAPSAANLDDKLDDVQRNTDFALNVLYVIGFLSSGDGGVEASRILGLLGLPNDTTMETRSFPKIEQALEKAGVCKGVFGNWIVESRKAFLSRNIPGILIQKFPLYGGENGKGILMDPRCFVDHFNALASVTQAMHMNLQHQNHMINDMRNTLCSESIINNDYVLGKLYNMERSIRRIENHLMGEVKPDVAPSSKGVIRFSISSKGLTSQMSLADVTIAFFR
jgi:hypothetical protein